jgi:hypothetical protein
MRTLEPKRVEHRDVIDWFSVALQLIWRRKLAYLAVTLVFFGVVMLTIRSFASIAPQLPAVVGVAGFLIFCAVALAIALSSLIMLSHQADHSQPVNVSAQLATLAPAQKDLIRMALLVFFVGAFYWIAYLSLSAKGNILLYCEELMNSFTGQHGLPLELSFHLGAGFLYFMLLVLISMRHYFSLPLIFFHDLDYHAAQQLGQRAIVMNIRPITTMLISWIVVLALAFKLLPWLSLLLLPLMGAYSYVAYRHIFHGEKENTAAQAILSHEAARVSVTH